MFLFDTPRKHQKTKCFLANVPILYPRKTAESLRFYSVFRRYEMGAFAKNGLTLWVNDQCFRHTAISQLILRENQLTVSNHGNIVLWWHDNRHDCVCFVLSAGQVTVCQSFLCTSIPTLHLQLWSMRHILRVITQQIIHLVKPTRRKFWVVVTSTKPIYIVCNFTAQFPS